MALHLHKVSKSFGSKLAVDKISFSMEKPGVFGLLGTNGAGKTTTIRMILGILSKDEGIIDWNGKPVTRETVSFGYLPEERGIYPKAKVSEQLMYFAKLRGMSSAESKRSIEKWLQKLQVAEYTNSIAEHLSKGNQQKIQFIASIVHNPELIILDEPFSGLDPVNTDLFKLVINELIDEGKFIVMSSHQMSTVEEYCQEILILKNGISLLQGNLKDIKRSYGRNKLSLKCPQIDEIIIEENNIKIEKKYADGYDLKISSDDQAYRFLETLMKKSIRLDKFEIREPSLHEIFVEKVGE